ncbi:sensor domain-containing protein [Paludibacterium purpuratum]|uniref:PAS domain S-box-containing protein/diguanylate cyclase (GGDEF)-like protein n=1 Tax=Paludibacterium purpuratum TaxID=1144873 RepID=A0A4R7BCN6_9NEIS|nr:PAS domain S-box protein [Paludibacterium purpuratum]TDR81496.1 PAS domain S-box-containing protein/diguanylate cyclase (GGDEF)-like protein [Paludibacterium purpuratum]
MKFPYRPEDENHVKWKLVLCDDPLRHWPQSLQCLLAALLTLLPFAAHSQWPTLWGTHSPLLLWMLPVIVSGYLGGLLPGLVATLLGAWLAGEANPAMSQSAGALLTFIGGGLTVSVLSQRSLSALRLRARVEGKLMAFAQLIDSTDDSVVASRDGALVTHWNRGAEQLFGYSADEMIGQSAEILVPKWLVAHELSVLARVRKGEHVPAYETQRIHKAGHLVDISTTVSTILDRQGWPIGISRISRDITHKKRAEQEKAEVEAKFRALVEQAITGVYIVQDRQVIYANQAFADIFGYGSPQEALEQVPIKLVAPQDRQRVVRNVLRRLRGDTDSLRYHFNALRRDGSPFIVEVHGRRFMHDNRPAIIGSLIDITESQRHQAEMARQVAEKTALLRQREQELHTILDNMPALISYYDTDLRHRFGNQGYCDWYGIDSTQLAGLPLAELLPAGQLARVLPRIRQALSGETQIFEYRIDRPGSGESWQAQIHLIPDLEGEQVHGLFALILDFTPIRNAEAALRESEGRFRQLFEAAPVGISLYHSDGQCIMANQALAELAGASREQLLKQNFRHVQTWRDSGLLTVALRTLESGLPQRYELQMVSSFGKRMEVECEFTLPVVQGVRYLMLLAKDITPYRQAAYLMKQAMDAELEKSRLDLQYRQVVENMVDGFFAIDSRGQLLETNDVFVKLCGYEPETLLGMSAADLELDASAEDIAARIHRIVHKGNERFECRMRRKNGTHWPAEISASCVGGSGDRIYAFVRDITERKRNEDEIRRLAFYDSLTKLPNRQLLIDRLQQALETCKRSRRHGALLFIDLDNFKLLNDTLGHDMGDRLLVMVAKRLKACVRGKDTVARLGGDEFVILLEELDERRERAATQIRAVAGMIMEALGQPYPLAQLEYHNTPSIGIAMFNDQENTSVEEQLKHADLAMYQAKAAGRNTLCFFDPVTQAELETRSTLEGELRNALRRDHLVLYYQPQIDRNGSIIGAEALVRWLHPERGLIPPAQFIGLAEECGLVHQLGLRVLEIACGQLAIWRECPTMSRITMAVNVSARQFRHREFVPQIRDLLTRFAIDPARLKLELTESLLLHDMDEAAAKMGTLRAMGVKFSLDDFGTGYSSLSYLKTLPLEQLKIDRSFVRDILTDPNDAAIVRAIINMGHSLGLKVVAEGVETDDQWHFLLREGCDIGQGYLFSPPVPKGDFERDRAHQPAWTPA